MPKPSDARLAHPIYVVQKHAARTLHYDFRLEAGGVLKSWAVPKGPSTDPGQKRLAIPTEDHPMDYASFEGVIPEGQYGAGTVLVWDLGTFRTLSGKDGKLVSLEDALDRGHATVWIEGRKIRGGYSLVRTGGAPPAACLARQGWLLIKMHDAEANPGQDPVMDEPASVLSGLTIEQIAAGS